MKKVLILGLFSIIFLMGCENPATNKTEAITKDTKTEETEIATTGETVSFSEENSKLDFVGSKVTGKEEGGFKKFDGKINLIDEAVSKSQVSVEIDMKSVYSNSKGLVEHLRTPDFFDVEKYPKATFISTEIKPDKEKGEDNYSVAGNLDFHGVKKSINFPAKITTSETVVKVESEFFINRRDFNVNYAGRANDLIRDEVVLKFDINAQRKK